MKVRASETIYYFAGAEHSSATGWKRLTVALRAGESAVVCFTVYILQSEKDQKRYIGVKSDLERRLDEHHRGMVRSTRNRRPLRLIHTETYPEKTDALRREQSFKSGQGREWLSDHAL